MQEYRCSKCNKVLFEAEFEGIIIKKCDRCKSVNNYRNFGSIKESQHVNAHQRFINKNEETSNPIRDTDKPNS